MKYLGYFLAVLVFFSGSIIAYMFPGWPIIVLVALGVAGGMVSAYLALWAHSL